MPSERVTDIRSPAGHPYLLLALAALFWGGNAVAGRLAIGHVSPMTLSLTRWILSGLIVIVTARRQVVADWPVIRTRLPYLAAVAGVGFLGFNALLYFGAYSTTAVNLTILQGAIPVFVLLGGLLAYGTAVTTTQALGVTVTLLGVALIASKGELATIFHLRFAFGDVLMILACGCYAAYTVALVRRPQVSALAMFSMLAFFAALLSLPLLGIEIAAGQSYWPTSQGWLIIAYVALFPSVLSQIFFIRGVEAIGASRAGIFVNLVPVFGAALAVWVLGEPFGWYQMTALALVIGGIVWSQRK
ncbi:MAG: DMT family transporter [Ancalomicrobiaceae bacterium]|nr:DMT family transporter [Ancalomicrobiaceae bacterium]